MPNRPTLVGLTLFVGGGLILIVLSMWRSGQSYSPGTKDSQDQELTANIGSSTTESPDEKLAASNIIQAQPVPSQELNASPAPSEQKSKTVLEIRPSTATLRQEVSENPHLTPKALLKFSVDLGEKLDKVTNEGEADALMTEIETCISENDSSGEKPAQSIQTICLLDAGHLKQKYPSLSLRYESLRSKAGQRSASAEQLIKGQPSQGN